MQLRKANTLWFPVPKVFVIKDQNGNDVTCELDPEEKSKVCIKELSPGERADISSKTLKLQQEFNSQDQRQSVTRATPDYWGFRSLNVAKCHADWEGFTDLDGKDMKCTQDNALQYINTVKGYLEFVEDCQAKLATHLAEKNEAEIKN